MSAQSDQLAQFRQKRALQHKDAQIVFATIERKLDIQTLLEVFTAFLSSADLKVLNYEFEKHDQEAVVFAYEGKEWRATITKENAMCRKKKAKFINIKLPNDSFIYSAKYAHAGGKDVLSESDDAIQLMQAIDQIVPFEGGYLDVCYKLGDERLEFYYEADATIDASKPIQMFTVKFEYGVYEKLVDGHRFPRAHLEQIAAQHNPKSVSK